ncbi:ATP-binding protein [Mixta tenebrionis]|uniref:ATP-binding protein n=1 Tax=Mixta tenebrionis TaxID=2562439 RepID=A0A506VCJ9_9GAMM|nr:MULTISPECIES: ATP-binding protein [Mixta]QHM75495.1 Anti-sigma F factor [Mixta theicola]TPW43375.1 ATP-binding protein [Mixta tenebrionis]
MSEPCASAFTLPATLNSLPLLGERLRQFLAPRQLAESWIFMLDLALCEAATNIIRHGYRQDKGESYHVTFSADVRQVIVTLRDEGQPIPPALLQAAASGGQPEPAALAELAESGRGLRLIYDCVDEVSYQQQGAANLMILRKNLPPAGA